MARDLKDSVDKLETTLRAVGTRVMTIGTKNANRKLDSFEGLDSVKKRLGMIEAQSRIGKFFSVIKESDKLFAADAWMSAHPNNRFKSAAEKVRFDEIVAERRKRDRMRGIRADKLFSEQMLAITDPDLAYRKSLEEKFQGASQGSDVAADEIIRAERSEKAKKIHSERRKRDRMKNIRASQSFRFAMLDSDEQFIQGAMRDKGWSRDQAEQVYFKNLTENAKWLRFIAKDNPKIAKNLIPIAKAIGKAGGLPFIGGLATNPALAAVGAAMFVSREYSKAIKENLNWVNLISVGGGISGGSLSAAAGGGLDYASALKLVQGSKRTAAKWKFGEGLDGIFRSTMYGADVSVFNPFATGEDRLRMIYNATKNIQDDGDRLAALEMWGASEEEYNQGRRLETPREQWSIEERISDRARQWKDWREWAKVHGTDWDKISAYTSPDWWIDFWSAREEIGKDKLKEFTSNLPFANTWNEVHDTAEIDDRYRAGMYDNSVTNNDTSRNVSLQVNVASPQITTTGDPVDFANGIAIIGSRALSEYQSVIENTDTKRKQ